MIAALLYTGVVVFLLLMGGLLNAVMDESIGDNRMRVLVSRSDYHIIMIHLFVILLRFPRRNDFSYHGPCMKPSSIPAGVHAGFIRKQLLVFGCFLIKLFNTTYDVDI